MKRRIASALIVVMLLSQFSMGFSFAESNQENESINNQNTVITDNLENSDADAGNTEITESADTGGKDAADNRNEDQTIEPAEAAKTENSASEEKVQMQLLAEEPAQPASSLESQLQKVTKYYSDLRQDTKLSSPMEGVARFAVGQRPSLEALENSISDGSSISLKVQ